MKVWADDDERGPHTDNLRVCVCVCVCVCVREREREMGVRHMSPN